MKFNLKTKSLEYTIGQINGINGKQKTIKVYNFEQFYVYAKWLFVARGGYLVWFDDQYENHVVMTDGYKKVNSRDN